MVKALQVLALLIFLGGGDEYHRLDVRREFGEFIFHGNFSALLQIFSTTTVGFKNSLPSGGKPPKREAHVRGERDKQARPRGVHREGLVDVARVVPHHRRVRVAAVVHHNKVVLLLRLELFKRQLDVIDVGVRGLQQPCAGGVVQIGSFSAQFVVVVSEIAFQVIQQGSNLTVRVLAVSSVPPILAFTTVVVTFSPALTTTFILTKGF
mmetsp:Transcript_2750/g.6675  ORF Transcript_2750/g.6675 Transcript_2750/m.6675 type:complete len:208 (-) Transcript_2750:681-1304(-)